MALNAKVFKTRALTALVFVAVMATGLLISKWLFLLLFLIIHMGCWYEFQSLMSRIDAGYRDVSVFHKVGIVLVGTGIMLYATADQWKIGAFSISPIGFWLVLVMIFVIPIAELLFNGNPRLRNLSLSVGGLAYISMSLSLLIYLRSGEVWRIADSGNLLYSFNQIDASFDGYLVPLIIIGSIWVNDTMAYLVGSLIGKTPLSKVSPKKTWEGTIGGILLSVTLLTLFAYFTNASWQHFLAISLISAVAGTVGDLFESGLKRKAGVKDSGSFMPGHGGFLDRFDSLLFAVPFVWLYAVLFM